MQQRPAGGGCGQAHATVEARCPVCDLADVAQAVAEDMPDVLVGQAVVDDPPGLATRNHASIAQQPQLVAQRRLADAEQQRQVAHAQLVGQAQGVEDARARRVGEHREGRGQLIRRRVVDDPPEQRRDVLGVEAFHLTPLMGEHRNL